MPKYDNNAKAWRSWYAMPRWRRLRRLQLQQHPLCDWCTTRGDVRLAEVVHHEEPHKGDITKFFDSKLVSLCKRCHDSIAQQIEVYGYVRDVGSDGWPVDANHPANKV